jgi:hypothetical protein
MSTSTDIHINGNGDANHDHILRPRAVKPSNPAVLRAMSDDKLLAANGNKEILENGGSSTAQTRCDSPSLALDVANEKADVQLQFQQMRRPQFSLYLPRESNCELSKGAGYSLQLNMPQEFHTSIPTAIIETFRAFTFCSG